jgi:hypothetical protein
MVNFVPALSPSHTVTAKPSREAVAGRVVFALAVTAVILMVLLNVFRRFSYLGDEGFYGITAVNMLHDSAYILRPSYFPQGDFAVEKDAFAHPPLNSYLYALALWFSNRSMAGLEILNGLFFGLLLLFSYRLLALFDVLSARFGVVLLAVSPTILHAYSQVEAEPLMCTVGVMALYYAARASFQAGQRAVLFLCGLCIGLAFAFKLWLFGPFALAVAVLLGANAMKSSAPLGRKIRGLLIVAVAALIPAAAHLLAVAIVCPEDLSFWLRKVYFGFFLREGISGGKLAGNVVDPRWIHPIWYYAGVLYRDNFLLIPVILLGLGPLLRDRRLNREFLWTALAGMAGLVLFSLMKIKEPLYILSCTIFIYFFAAACLAAFVRQLGGATESSRAYKFATILIVMLVAVFGTAFALGVKPREITPLFIIVHSIALPLLLALFWRARRATPRFGEWSVYGACAATIAAASIYTGMTRYPRDETVTRMIQPYIENNSPKVLSLVATEYKAYQFYAFRRGCYWDELPLAQPPERVFASPELSHARAFVIELEDLTKPEMKPWIAWLETHTVEKTADLDATLGVRTGARLFVR